MRVNIELNLNDINESSVLMFLNNELRSDSLQILTHKKICNKDNNCFTKKIEDNFSSEVKEKILTTARLIKIEEAKKEKK